MLRIMDVCITFAVSNLSHDHYMGVNDATGLTRGRRKFRVRLINPTVTIAVLQLRQVALLLQRGRAMLCVRR